MTLASRCAPGSRCVRFTRSKPDPSQLVGGGAAAPEVPGTLLLVVFRFRDAQVDDRLVELRGGRELGPALEPRDCRQVTTGPQDAQRLAQGCRAVGHELEHERAEHQVRSSRSRPGCAASVALQPSKSGIIGADTRRGRASGGHRQHAHRRVDSRDSGMRATAGEPPAARTPVPGAHVHDAQRGPTGRCAATPIHAVQERGARSRRGPAPSTARSPRRPGRTARRCCSSRPIRRAGHYLGLATM